MIPAWINTAEYPFTPKRFAQPMGTMSYVDEGSGDPFVMVHGNPSWSFEFRALIKHFAQTHRCIAPDHIGFGLSDKPAEWTYLPQQHAENLERLLESLNLNNITLIFDDWGGPIALSYAIKHPEKVKNIIVTNTWLWPVNDDWYYRAFSGFMGGPIGRWLIRRYNFFAWSVVKVAYGDKSKLTPEVHRHFLQALPEGRRKGSYVFPKQIIGATDWLAGLWNQRQKLDGKVKLIAWGMKDIAFREKEMRRWAAAFPTAVVVRYSNAGHFVAEEEAPALINHITQLKVLE
jgi:pimeloyl-ACP methyl ester carboxylesterase